jgi:BMFP domain-containing protein YqiC
MAELTQAEKDLHQYLLSVLFDERDCPMPVHFAARAEIRNLRARVEELEGKKNAKGEKGGTAKIAEKSE